MAAAGTTVREVARALAVDVATAEAVSTLRARGVPSLLLRGPAIARRVYPPGAPRSYLDADLMVPPDGRRRAEAALRELGYAPVVGDAELAGHRPLHAHEWLQAQDGVAIDLHRALSGASAPPEDQWRAFAEGAETLAVAGAEVDVPSLAATALGIALHAAHHGPRRDQPVRDLRAALERLGESVWREAAALAGRIGAASALAAGLRLEPAGELLARRLGLPSEVPVDVALRASSPPPLALGLEWLLRTPGVRAKAVLLARTLAPTPGALRTWRALARRPGYGLACAYATHPLWLARHAPSSLAAVLRARRAER